jgi:cell pole-organizing protein PopZ
MEDILASIRRILDDDGGAKPPSEGAATADAIVPGEDVFELDQSMMIEESAPVSFEPLATGVEPVVRPDTPHADAANGTDALLAPATAAAASASLGALARAMGQRQTQVYREGPTLEDLVREEMRPLVKAWLDEHLAGIVERMVRQEIERVTRSGY